MLALVGRARRRLLQNDLLSQGVITACAAVAAFIILLLAGTQILDWRWLVFIPAGAVAAGLYRVYRRLPSLYRVAQIVDERLSLHDTLSTAFFFSGGNSMGKISEEVRSAQFESAQSLAQSVDLRRALPYTLPRGVYALTILVALASGLFGLRYGLNRRLDLKPPLASILGQSLGYDQPKQQAKNNRKPPKPEAQPRDAGGDQQDDQAQQQQQSERQDDTANAEDPNSSSAVSQDSKKSADSKKPGEEGPQAQSEEGSQGDEQSGDEGENSGNPDANKQSDKQNSGAKDASNSGENSSLMSKMKDAFQNIMSRMKPQQGQSGSQQSAQDQKGQQGKGQQQNGKQSAKNGQQQNSGQQSDSQEGDAGEQAQNQQDAQGKGTGKSDSPQASKQPGSGIGSQDGDKNIKQAEQLAAMGKISEILGKRSATISGESSVEVQNTSQQLHTAYAQRSAQHAQGGAEINRDEVPVALQSYVESYFEQVRKQAPPKQK